MPVPVFHAGITELLLFDPGLADHLRTIRGRSDLRKLLYSDIDGTASRVKDNQVDIELDDTFLNSCCRWYDKGAEVHWICVRGVDRGSSNLRSLRGDHSCIQLAGCDGNETLIGQNRTVKKTADFTNYIEPIADLMRSFDKDPIMITGFGWSVLAVFVDEEHSAHPTFMQKMGETAQRLQEETGQEYRVTCDSDRITLQRADTIGKRQVILDIRARQGREIGLEIYGGNDESDIEAQREVNSQPYGFAYRVLPTKEELFRHVPRGRTALDGVSGLIDGPKQWSRFIRMVVAEL